MIISILQEEDNTATVEDDWRQYGRFFYINFQAKQ